ncbi:hypothetical protein JCM14469_14830 [Desulfatiferula olefinivorans]
MFLKHISIKARLTYAFIIVGLFFLIFGIYAILEMNRLSKLTTDLYRHPYQVTRAALNAETQIIRIHSDIKELTFTRSNLGRTEVISRINKAEEDVYRQLDIIKDSIPGDAGLALENETRRLLTNWRSLRDEIIQFVKEEKNDEAALVIRKKGDEQVALLQQKLAELNDDAKQTADGYLQIAGDIDGRIIVSTAIAIVVIVLVSAFLAYILIDSIVSDVLRLKIIMSKIEKTGKLEKSNLTGKNEVVSMARHFNNLIDMLQGQLYLREGISDMIRDLSGNLPYDELVSKGLNYIARYTDACIGALYAYDKNTKTCRLTASYAFVDRKYLSESFKAGEGIVGQVALERKPIHLHNIERTDALANTGTVSEPPRSIYTVPLIFDHMLYGVLELGSFEPFSKPKIDFLNAAAINLSSYLFSSVQNEEIQRLLQESRNANNSLQARTDEVNEANEKLTAMNEELQAQSRELQAQTEELEVQKTELEIQRSRVEEADRLKSEFLSNMSHELRTPLNSVLALSQLMISRGTGNDPDQESEYLKVIERNGRQLLALINDILDLSKIEAGKMDIYMTDFDTRALVERALSTIIPLAAKKGLRVEKDLDDAPYIHSDEDKINQILLNLFSNAVKFTDKGQITARVATDNGHVHFTVTDTGIGIDKKDLHHIFDEFRQVDGSTTRSHEGTGLGLAICAKLADLLGGSIHVDSDPDKGSRFTLTLPLAKVDEKDVRERQQQESRRIEREREASSNTVVVIDDDPDIRAEMKTYLTQAGYHVETARNGKQGIELVRALKPMAVTLDIMMPEMDGWEVVRLLKESRETDKIPIVIVSVSNDQQTGMALGAAGYIVKPLNRERILSAIQSIGNANGGNPGAANDILVVEDNDIAGLQIRSALEERGYRIRIASNGNEALETIKQSCPRAIILDLMMPGMDGFQVLDSLRAAPETRDLPILVLSAKELSSDERARLSHNKVRQLIRKGSIDRNQLVDCIETLLGIGGPEDRKADEKAEIKAPESVHEKKDPKALKILVVEDNPDNLLTINALLTDAGYNHFVAQDGHEALSVAASVQPDIILMDIQLPGLSGLDVTTKLKEDKTLKGIPVIALTAKAMRGDRESLMASGFDDYISKPIDPDVLIDTIRKWS